MGTRFNPTYLSRHRCGESLRVVEHVFGERVEAVHHAVGLHVDQSITAYMRIARLQQHVMVFAQVGQMAALYRGAPQRSAQII